MLPSEKALVLRVLGEARSYEEAVTGIEALGTSTPCRDCDHFSHTYCRLANTNIPKEVQRVGCEMFEEEIPF